MGGGQAEQESDWPGELYRSVAGARDGVVLTAIPYYAWDNRAPGEMRVWLGSATPG